MYVCNLKVWDLIFDLFVIFDLTLAFILISLFDEIQAIRWGNTYIEFSFPIGSDIRRRRKVFFDSAKATSDVIRIEIYDFFDLGTYQ